MIKNLQLERPIVFFDIESTGNNPHRDRIVELAMIKVLPDGTRQQYVRRFNPEMPIDPAATAVHGITNEDVAHEPTFADKASEIKAFLEGCDLGGYNAVRFDVPMLQNEFNRVKVSIDLLKRRLVDVQRIFHIKEPRDLAAAYRFYCEKTLEKAHLAAADIAATIEILDAQLERYRDLPRTVDGLYDFIGRPFDRMLDASRRFVLNKEGKVVFNFGKYKGRVVEEVFAEESGVGYYQWIQEKDFSADTKRVATEIFERVRKKKKGEGDTGYLGG